jgi:hypothetical protein
VERDVGRVDFFGEDILGFSSTMTGISGPDMVVVSRLLWQAGTTPVGHRLWHSSHVRPEMN